MPDSQHPDDAAVPPRSPGRRISPPAAAKVTNIATHRAEKLAFFQPPRPATRTSKAPGRTSMAVMGLAAAVPPVFWLLHSLIHVLRAH